MGQYSGKFGSLKYDDDKIKSALAALDGAKGKLATTQAALNDAYNHLMQAANIEWLDIDASNQSKITNLPDDCIEYIDRLYEEIKSKAAEIEKYRDAPWYKKVFGTRLMVISKLTEGILTVGENIVDAGVSLVGFTAGIFGAKDFRDSCGEFVKKDHIGEFYDKYISGSDTWIGTYSAMSPESTAARLFKGVGVAAGYIALAAATGGATGLSSTAANTLVAAAGGLGAGTERGLQEGKSFNRAFLSGVKQAAIQGGTAYVAGRIGDKLQANKTGTQTVYDNNATNAIKRGAEAGVDKLKNTAIGKGVIKAGSAVKTAGTKVGSAVKTVGTKVGNLVTKTPIVGKAVQKGAIKLGTGVSKLGAGATKLGAGVSKLGSGAITTIASHPVAAQVLTAGLVTAPSIHNELKKGAIIDSAKEAMEISQRSEATAKIFGEDGDISTVEDRSGSEDENTYIQDNVSTNPSDNSLVPDNKEKTNDTKQATNNLGNGGKSSTVRGRANSDVIKPKPPYISPSDSDDTGIISSNTPTKVNPVDTTPSSTNSDTGGSTTQAPTNTDTAKITTPVTDTTTTGGNPTATTTVTPSKSTTSISSSGTNHSGGGYSNDGYSYNESSTKSNDSSVSITNNGDTAATQATSTKNTPDSSVIAGSDDSNYSNGALTSAITNTRSYKNSTIKIPTPSDPIESTAKNNVVIPTTAAFSAAAAAGIGAKAYMEHIKEKSNDSDEEAFDDGTENDGIYAEEWNGNDDDISLDYGNDQSEDLEDDYSYSADSIIQKYESTGLEEM